MARNGLARAGRMIVAGSAAGLLVAGCASGSGGVDAAGGAAPQADDAVIANGIVGVDEGSDPQKGGTIAYAGYSSVRSLDPADRQDGGSTGGTAMAAIYDLLIRYDTDDDEYVPQLAKSLTSEDDDTVWTLRLRDGVTFSDGTPLDADAVVWSIERYLDKNGTHAQVWKDSVDSMSVVDPHTVRFTLKQPWPRFPTLFTSGPGMIVAPSSEDGDGFTPVGAGPFIVQKFSPQDELVLTAREDYSGGTPYLSTLRFPAMANEQTRLDSVRSGDIQIAYLRNQENVAEAAGSPGAVYTANMSGLVAINNREGRAGHDPRVRKAVVAAFSPDQFDELVQSGAGQPSSRMFAEQSRWYDDDVKAAGYDPEEAKRLVSEAKADGFDGTLTYVGMNTPGTKDSAIAIDAMLEKVGFDVNVEYTTDISDLVKRLYVQHDYDVAYAGFNVLDDSPFIRMYGNFHSDSNSNMLGYDDPEMDALLARLQEADGDDEVRDVLGDIQDRVNETAPMAVSGPYRLFMPFTDDVRGVKLSSDGILLFDDAWTTD